MTSNYIEEGAERYLREKRILELFEDICTAVAFE